MRTAEEIAQVIINTKPDISDFLSLLKSGQRADAIKDIQTTTNLEVKLLKAEVFLLHYNTHICLYYNATDVDPDLPQSILMENVSDCNITKITRTAFDGTLFDRISTDHFIEGTFKVNHILNYIPKPKQYLTKYLWNKVRSKVAKPIDVKQLNPDEFSFTVFKQYLSTRKKLLTSADTIRYLDQLNTFKSDIRDKYIDLLFSNCQPIATKTLNQLLYYHLPDKYTCIQRYVVRNMAVKEQIPVPPSICDNRDSAYVPFIANVPRRVTSDLPNLSSLVGTLSVLTTLNNIEPSVKYKIVIDSLTEHLSHPDYKEALTKYGSTLQHQQSYYSVITSLLGDN